MEDKHSFPDPVSIKGKQYGITTGSAATAAALAALLSLNQQHDQVKIKTPLGELEIEVESSKKLTDTHGRAAVIKRPYDDPDVTKNLKIVADIYINDKKGVVLKGGEGVGMVTKPGLQVPVGQPAINPVPQAMIKSNLQDFLPPGKGAEVIISIPAGAELAQKTLNPRLGVVGGISILGTTGIARSMNSESYRKSFKCQIDVAVAEGYRELVFVPGNIGERIAREILDVHEDQIIQMGNFVGFMLSEASQSGVQSIILLGHAGKIIKLAAGIFNTKHSTADGRREIIAAHAALSGADNDVVRDIFESNTTEDMINILNDKNLVKPVFNSIALSIKDRCQERYDMEFDVIIAKMDGSVLNSNHLIKVN
jgi:cobalt-precorrin-5B (C1)-methyltransferase